MSILALVDGIGKAIAAAFKFGEKAIDGDNNEKNFDLKDRKRTNTAMNAAEQHIFAVDSFINKSITVKQLDYLHKKYRKIFFANN